MKLIDIEKLNLPYYNDPDDEYEMQFNAIMQEFAQRIKSMETIDYTPVKHGRWMGTFRYGYYCSNCKRTVHGLHKEELIESYRYCPYCGARMDMEEK